MSAYQPPIRDIQFVLHELLAVERAFSELPPYRALERDTLDQIIEAAAAFATGTVLPLNRVGDLQGCRYESGAVTTPPGFAAAYREFCELGWPALCCDPEFGGQGLPQILFSVSQEMFSACSHAWQMSAGINLCAYHCLLRAGDEQLKARWLPRLVDGSVLPTMCMSEPQAGSDIGLTRARAVAGPDGGYRVTGTKIFVTNGDQDLSGDILHLVLARLPEAPAGSKGLSLFAVPKFLDSGERNPIHCESIEYKLGLHGSPTCVMSFEGAQGWLVGEAHRGLAAMFFMMNPARLLSGLQAVGVSDAAFQRALAYARERRQGRAPGHGGGAAGPSAILEHPDVERMLLIQKAYVEGGRSLVHWTALLLDQAQAHPDPDERAAADELLAVLTPVVKGFLAENAQSSTYLAQQVFGAHGYVSGTGIDQYARDVRIVSIYEGTSGIQAIDLLLRKVLSGEGGKLRGLQTRIEALLFEVGDVPAMQEFARPLAAQWGLLERLTETIRRQTLIRPRMALELASDYLRLLGHVVLAYLWALAARVALARLAEAEAPFYRAKLTTARFYFVQLLPETARIAAVIESDAGPYEMAFE